MFPAGAQGARVVSADREQPHPFFRLQGQAHNRDREPIQVHVSNVHAHRDAPHGLPRGGDVGAKARNAPDAHSTKARCVARRTSSTRSKARREPRAGTQHRGRRLGSLQGRTPCQI